MDVEKTSIIDELDRISASSQFRAKPVMRKLLTYLVTEYVEGRSDQIKGYSVGLDVFGRGDDFDPARSALVRNNALRLRNLLTTYYLGEGKNDPVRIDIPKGKYVPRVWKNKADSVAAPRPETDDRLPTIAVMRFRNLSSDPGLDFLADGLSQALSDTLTKFDDLRLIGLGWGGDVDASPARFPEQISDKGIQFLVDGDIQAVGANVKVSVRLISSADRSQLWGTTFRFDLEQDDWFDIEEQVAEQIASQIGAEYGRINQYRYQAMLKSRPRTLSEQAILLKHYHYVTVLTEAAMTAFHKDVVAALEREPESALLNAIAGGLYGNIWAFAGPDADEALEKLARLTEKAYALNPQNPLVLGSLGFKCFVFDERDRFFTLFEQCKDGLPNSPLRLGAWAIHTCYFGEWERGMELHDRVFQNNLHVPLWLHGAPTMYYYRLHDYETALVEANKLRVPGLFWGPAYRTAVLGQLGRLAEAEKEFEVLLERRPDFEQKGRFLMGCYIKETSLLEHVLDGFRKIGVEIA